MLLRCCCDYARFVLATSLPQAKTPPSRIISCLDFPDGFSSFVLDLSCCLSWMRNGTPVLHTARRILQARRETPRAQRGYEVVPGGDVCALFLLPHSAHLQKETV